MDTIVYENKAFKDIDYTEKDLHEHEFTNCTFTNCEFSKSNLSNVDFMDCTFTNCNMALSVLTNTAFKNITFVNSKLMGMDFGKCNPFLFSATFQNCQLDYSSFFQRKMKKATFTDCSLKHVDFAETDLTQAVFKNCDLADAAFDRTILEKADLRTARNYALDPDINKIKKAKFSYQGAVGLLAKYDIDIEFE